MSKIKIILLTGLALFIVHVGVTAVIQHRLNTDDNPKDLTALSQKYNNITVFEDGSYSGKTVTGEQIQGCLAGGLCERDFTTL